jgi:hypothetical protein
MAAGWTAKRGTDRLLGFHRRHERWQRAATFDQFSAAVERLNTLVAPLVYVPGDNEWTDCHRTNDGSYGNPERLEPRSCSRPLASALTWFEVIGQPPDERPGMA